MALSIITGRRYAECCLCWLAQCWVSLIRPLCCVLLYWMSLCSVLFCSMSRRHKDENTSLFTNQVIGAFLWYICGYFYLYMSVVISCLCQANRFKPVWSTFVKNKWWHIWSALSSNGANLFDNKFGATPFCLLDIWATRHFVNLPFCKHHYATWHLSNSTFCQQIILLKGHFVNLTFEQLNILSIWHLISSLFCQLAILSTCHFVNMLFFQLDILSTCHFVNTI